MYRLIWQKSHNTFIRSDYVHSVIENKGKIKTAFNLLYNEHSLTKNGVCVNKNTEILSALY